MHRTLGAAIGTAALVVSAAAVAQPAGLPPMPKPSPEEQARIEAAYTAYFKQPDTEGTGSFAALKEMDPSLPNHVVYRPKDLANVGAGQLGVVGWGNGACSRDGAGSRFQLAEIASYGYVVIAPGVVASGPGAVKLPPPPKDAPKFHMETTTADVTAGIDWALAENARPGSPYYGKIDPGKVAVAGFSCGGAQAMELAGDPRIKTVMMENSGLFPDSLGEVIPGITARKATLKTLHGPILYILGGEKDIAYKNGLDDFSRIDQVPVVLVSNDAGHGGDFLKPNGGPSGRVAVQWLQWQLRGDKKAEAMFVGPDCGLCKDPEWKLQRKNLPAE